VDVKIEITLDSKHLSKLQDFLEDLKTSSSIAAKGQQQINQNNNNNQHVLHDAISPFLTVYFQLITVILFFSSP